MRREVVLPGFSERVKLLRKERKSRRKDMAVILECTESHYQKIEYGQINLFTLDLITLADYFNVSVDYLLGFSDRRKRR
ncbi:MAG: helix-turn-helix transcriptional regulator [Oscillospiraceae bacterium]|nr:helix-turn-helix transcriptional regulator [Oscillospiraceae bacterium]